MLTVPDTYRIVESLDDRLRADLVELYRHEWWTKDRSDRDVAQMLQHSDLVIGLCEEPSARLVAFARVLTDRVYKALVFDLIVEHGHRREGIGRLLMEHVLAHPMVAGVKHVELYCLPQLTAFYQRWGFSTNVSGVQLMRRERIDLAIDD